MTRQNPPRLIDPKNAVLAATDRSIGVPQPHDLAQRLAELESLIGNLNGEVNALKRAARMTDLDGAQIIGADVLIKPRAQLVAIEESPSEDQLQALSNSHFEEAFGEVKSSVGEWLAQARKFAQYDNESGTYDELAAFLKKYTR